MFVGREKELKTLNNIYNTDYFEFLVIYGRRRVGKTELLKEFIKGKNALFYPALDQKTNLDRFTEYVLKYFGETAKISFKTWEDLFIHVAEKLGDEKLVLIIDEFPYIAKNENVILSTLQNVIDHYWKNKNIKLILCGSSVSFMVNGVLSEKSPLFDRNTAVMEVLPFDYDAVGSFLPSYTKEEQMIVYGIVGGVPYYLSRFNDKKSLKENLSDVIFSSYAPLREEVTTLLKAELREPATYNQILASMANGARSLGEIASKAKMDITATTSYMKILTEMKIIKKILPCGDKENSRKGQYIISDNFVYFWYKFVYSASAIFDFVEPLEYIDTIYDDILRYMGSVFEEICFQYLKHNARLLPFLPTNIGKWWGGNMITHQPTDIDILAFNRDKYLFCECKFRNVEFSIDDFDELIMSSNQFSDAKHKYYCVFVKSAFSKEVIEESKKYNARLITIDEM